MMLILKKRERDIMPQILDLGLECLTIGSPRKHGPYPEAEGKITLVIVIIKTIPT